MTTTFNKLSITELGEQFADTNLSSTALAREVNNRLPSYVEKQDKETKQKFMSGFSKRWLKEYPDSPEYLISIDNKWVVSNEVGYKKAERKHERKHIDLVELVENGSKWSALKNAEPMLFEVLKPSREKLRKFRNDQHNKLIKAIKELDKKSVERVSKDMLEIATETIKSQIDRLKKQVDKNDDWALAMQKEYYSWLQDGKRLIENIKRNAKRNTKS